MNTMKMRNSKASSAVSRQAGFILTMELMIILTVLGIGLLVGFIAVRDALFKYYVTQQSREVVVEDAAGTSLGRAVGFDEHEAPLLVYVDRSQEENYRALIGVRDDRFTSREPVYYTLPNCQGDPCMKRPSKEALDNQGVELIPGTGAVSYLYALQGGPTYAIGAGPDGDRIKGNLFRSGIQSCAVDELTAVLGSRWISQKVVDGEPCEPYVLPLPIPEPALVCPQNLSQGRVCGSGCDTRNNQCSCPAGYDEYNLRGPARACCPAGSEFIGDLLNPVCEGGEGLVYAESVPSIGSTSRNALDALLAPFTVNLPIDTDAGSWNYIPPGAEDGSEFQ